MDEWDNPHRTRAPPLRLHEYFASLSPMALGVCTEILSARDRVGPAWDGMDEDERDKAIDDAFTVDEINGLRYSEAEWGRMVVRYLKFLQFCSSSNLSTPLIQSSIRPRSETRQRSARPSLLGSAQLPPAKQS